MYCGDDEVVGRRELANLPMISQGPRHNPTSFYSYVNHVAEALDNASVTIDQEEYVLTKDRQTFFGAMQIRAAMFDDYDFNVTIGVRGSHTQKVSRGLLIGESVIICSNLCFDGDLGTWNTKQTTYIEQRLPSMIKAAIDQLPERVESRVETFDRMKDQRLTTRYGDAKLVDLFRAGGLSGNELPRAINEWYDPSFEHGEDLTLWRLFNAATQALKPTGSRVNMQTIAERSTIVSRELSRLVE
jgi:hypothetical protein